MLFKTSSVNVISVLIDSGSCLYPYTIQEHRRNVQQRFMEPCLPPGSLVWNIITHSHIQVLILLYEYYIHISLPAAATHGIILHIEIINQTALFSLDNLTDLHSLHSHKMMCGVGT